MIFFFCGAPKHASHFQQNIVLEALIQKGINFEEIGDRSFHYPFDFNNAQKLLEEFDNRSNEIICCKGHWGTPRERNVLLSCQNIRIFLIWRDIKDVLVSQYYYDMSKYRNKANEIFKDFPEYYWNKGGRYSLFYHYNYYRVWSSVANNPKVFNSYFTPLKQNFKIAAHELLSFAEIANVDLSKLEEKVSLVNLRKKYSDSNGQFFRRGLVGEHISVIKSDDIYEDIAHIVDRKYDFSYLIHNLKLACKHPNYLLISLKRFISKVIGVHRIARIRRIIANTRI